MFNIAWFRPTQISPIEREVLTAAAQTPRAAWEEKSHDFTRGADIWRERSLRFPIEGGSVEVRHTLVALVPGIVSHWNIGTAATSSAFALVVTRNSEIEKHTTTASIFRQVEALYEPYRTHSTDQARATLADVGLEPTKLAWQPDGLSSFKAQVNGFQIKVAALEQRGLFRRNQVFEVTCSALYGRPAHVVESGDVARSIYFAARAAVQAN